MGRRKAGRPIVGVVGYTSAGKSSLVAALSGKHLEAKERYALERYPSSPYNSNSFGCTFLDSM